jgi:hypothetical protein
VLVRREGSVNNWGKHMTKIGREWEEEKDGSRRDPPRSFVLPLRHVGQTSCYARHDTRHHMGRDVRRCRHGWSSIR